MKLFSVLTRKSIRHIVKVEAELLCKLLSQKGWFLKTNALLGVEYLGKDYPNALKLLYVPVGSMEVKVECNTPAPTQEIIEWADGILAKADLHKTEVNRSFVYSMFGYKSAVVPLFVLATDKRVAKIATKIIKAAEYEIPVISQDFLPRKLEELGIYV